MKRSLHTKCEYINEQNIVRFSPPYQLKIPYLQLLLPSSDPKSTSSKMVCIKNILLLVVGASAAVIPAMRRDVDATVELGLDVLNQDLLDVSVTISLGTPTLLDVTVDIDGVTADLQKAITDIEDLTEAALKELETDAEAVASFLQKEIVAGVQQFIKAVEGLKSLLGLLNTQLLAAVKEFRAQLGAYLIKLAETLPAITAEINTVAEQLDAQLVKLIAELS